MMHGAIAMASYLIRAYADPQHAVTGTGEVERTRLQVMPVPERHSIADALRAVRTLMAINVPAAGAVLAALAELLSGSAGQAEAGISPAARDSR